MLGAGCWVTGDGCWVLGAEYCMRDGFENLISGFSGV